MTKLTKNCECCDWGYSSGKEYGDFSMQWAYEINEKGELIKVKPSGLCPKCNPKSEFFCCTKHNTAFKIGHFWYRPENNFEKSNE